MSYSGWPLPGRRRSYPEVLILDEPTANLEVSVKTSIIGLPYVENLTYLFITHEIDNAKHVSDRIAVMYLGRIVEQGPTGEIFENPRHSYTQSLLASVPIPDPQLRSELKPISGEVPSAIDLPSGCAFHTRCPYAFERSPEELPTDHRRPPMTRHRDPPQTGQSSAIVHSQEVPSRSGPKPLIYHGYCPRSEALSAHIHPQPTKSPSVDPDFGTPLRSYNLGWACPVARPWVTEPGGEEAECSIS